MDINIQTRRRTSRDKLHGITAKQRKKLESLQVTRQRVAFDSPMASESFDRALGEQRALQDRDPEAAMKPTAPIFQFAASQEIERDRQLYESGDRYALMRAIYQCARTGLVMPSWVSDGFCTAWHKVNQAREKSWDAVLGQPWPVGAQLRSIRRRRDERSQLRYALEIAAPGEAWQGVPKPTRQQLVEVGKVLGRSRPYVEKLYGKEALRGLPGRPSKPVPRRTTPVVRSADEIMSLWRPANH